MRPRNIKRLLLGILLGAVLFTTLAGPAPVLAQEACPGGVCSTAFGNIDTNNPQAFIGQILTLAVGIGGAIALLLMLFGLFIITTSSGMPDKIKNGQEIITSAAIGLIFIVISIIVFKIIGVDILAIPGL